MQMGGETYGVRKDGTLGLCRAKPENQGKGRCFHEKHVFITKEELKLNIVQLHNEDILGKEHPTPEHSKTSIPENVTSERIQSHKGGQVLSKKELEEGSMKVAESFRDTDWSFIKDFYRKYDRALNDEERAEMFKNNPADNIADYLESDDPAAQRLRGFLGDEINVHEFSEILVQQVGAMTNIKKWEPKGNSLRRAFMSALNNDMNKERYVASVVFFGGRCCYCNKTLRRYPPPDRQATGEHITPITPKRSYEVAGGTRYGNMALACMGCNKDRGNEKLNDWISKTSRIKKESKENVLGRIKAFREFALYNEYTPEENRKINASIKEIKEYIESQQYSDGRFKSNGIGYTVNNKIKIATFDLQHD